MVPVAAADITDDSSLGNTSLKNTALDEAGPKPPRYVGDDDPAPTGVDVHDTDTGGDPDTPDIAPPDDDVAPVPPDEDDEDEGGDPSSLESRGDFLRKRWWMICMFWWQHCANP
jgi:hypothetical protein